MSVSLLPSHAGADVSPAKGDDAVEAEEIDRRVTRPRRGAREGDAWSLAVEVTVNRVAPYEPGDGFRRVCAD
jgi:hypothetical protein